MKQFFVAALAAMTVFASCSKDSDNSRRGGEGEDTKMGLTISFPSNTGTRATDPDAQTTQEMNVDNITVFLFGTNGEPVKGNMTVLALSDFVPNQSGLPHVYTLKHDKRIVTTTGVKSIYVGVNLTDSDFFDLYGGGTFDATTNESGLNELYKTTIAELTIDKEVSGGGKFLMFSTQVEQKELVAESDPNWFDNNTVSVSVERQIAKMTADYPGDDEAGVQIDVDDFGKHEMQGYYLGQAGKGEMYRNPVVNLAGKRLTTTKLTNLGFTHLYQPLNAPGKLLNASDRNSFFGIENVSLNNINRETTVAVFWATFTPKYLTTKSANYDDYMGEGDREAAWEDVAWIPVGSGTKALKDPALGDVIGNWRDIEEGSFWVVKRMLAGAELIKFFNSQELALDYIRDFNLAGYTVPPISKTQLYQKGHTFFYVYLRNDEVSPLRYEFVRNQYYHLTVQGFGGLGHPGTLDPQTPPTVDPTDPGTEPKEPSDPTNPIPPGEPELPEPEEPTPGNEDETTLRVVVNVLPWYVKVMDNIVLTK